MRVRRKPGDVCEAWQFENLDGFGKVFPLVATGDGHFFVRLGEKKLEHIERGDWVVKEINDHGDGYRGESLHVWRDDTVREFYDFL